MASFGAFLELCFGQEFLELQNRGVDRAVAFAKSLPADLSPVEQDRRFLAAAGEEIVG